MAMQLREILRRKRTLLGILISSVFLIGFLLFGRVRADAPDFVTAPVQRGAISNVVTANGTLQAVRTVEVGSQISGRVAALYADYNSTVKQGQLLALIDPRTFETEVATAQAQVASASARLSAAQADVANQEAGVAQAEANLAAVTAEAQNATLQYERASQLRDKGLISRNDYDVAKTNADTAKAKVSQAKAALDQARSGITSRNAQVKEARAEISGASAGLQRASVNLGFTKIVSPVDGVVISRNVNIGQTVAASLQAPVLFVIANDLAQMQVKASVDEADIGRISNNTPAEFTVDAYPNEIFRGNIDQIRLEPQTVQNVVTYNVMVGVSNPDLKLKPGMTANLRMIVTQRDDVLSVPNAALRFKPEGFSGKRPNVGREPNQNVIWVLDKNGKPRPETITVGITDGARTEILNSQLKEGDSVIIGNTASNRPAATPSPLGMPYGGGRGGRRGGL
jgi:HlyD family secretion protein